MPTEPLTLDGELDRQLRAVRRKETDKVVCPWHGNIVDAESGNCCVEMDEARERLAQAHLEQIRKRVIQIRSGLRNRAGMRDKAIQCPYCGEFNRPENTESPAHWKRPNVNLYCCDSFFMAVSRLAEHDLVQKQIDHARRIQDNLDKVSQN